MNPDHLKPLLLTPGPVPLHPEVEAILALPMIHHRTQAFTQYLMNSLEGLKKIFHTQEGVFILSSTGSGGMEALLANTLAPGDRVLSIVSGKFGQRWYEMALRFPQVEVQAFQVPYGQDLDLDALEAKIKSFKPNLLLCQATETSTGQKHPLAKISSIFHRQNPDGLFLVDGITAVGAYPVLTDEWELDAVVAGSQKAFMLPTGLSFVTLSKRAWKKKLATRMHSYYWDLELEKKANEKKQTFFSSNITLIRALAKALELILQSPLSQHYEEIAYRSQKTREALSLFGIPSFAQTPSESVSAFAIPGGSSQLRDILETQYQLTLMDGQDELKNVLLRVGHMGYIPKEDLKESLKRMIQATYQYHPQKSQFSKTPEELYSSLNWA